MRAVIRKDNFSIEFTGRGQTWNELLRPYLGGPEAPHEAEQPRPAPAPQPVVTAAAPTPRPNAPVQLVPHRVEPAPIAAAAPRPQQPMSTTPLAPRPSAPSQPRTWYPPREQHAAHAPRRFEPPRQTPQSAPTAYSSEEVEENDVPHVEPSSDPATLYGRLASLPGRRSERDAVLAAVWFLTKGEREATTDEVERHFEALHVFPDLKVVPHVLKHVHRTKMLETGSNPKAVRLSKKGLAGVRGRLVLAE